MSFSDHKITQFAHKITDLPDQPSLPANELKARFDSSPEELRQAVNGICDEASRLEARVEGIVVDTFGDTIGWFPRLHGEHAGFCRLCHVEYGRAVLSLHSREVKRENPSLSRGVFECKHGIKQP